MITFSNIIKLITLVWLMNILSAGYCKAENSNLDCTIAPRKNNQEFNPRKIPVVNKCTKGYENKSIIERCEVLINRKAPLDPELFRPVISNIKNVAYWNIYCASCNNDNETKFLTFQSWNRNNNDRRCGKLKQRIQRSESDDIHNLTQTFINEGAKLVAERYDNTQMECSINGKWPFHLIFQVIPCLYENFLIGQATRLKPCQYSEKTGRICAGMKLFYDGLVFYFQNNKEIRLNETLSEYKDFAPGQYYVESEYPGVFYICDLPATIYGGMHSVKISIVVISLIFIVFNLGINTNKQHLQKNNTNKLLYLYMAGLIPISIILLLIYLPHPVPCVAFYLAQFLWAYHFFWSMLIFIEFCLLTFGTLHNRFVRGSRYVIYCIFGFAIPLAMPIIYYFGVLVLNENYKEDLFSQPSYSPYDVQYTCPTVPNHFGVSCTSYEKFGSRYYEKWLEIFLSPSFYFFMPALFLLISIVVLCYFLKYRSDRTRSIPNRDQLIVITKMALIMGIHWLLFEIYQSYGNDHSIRILGVSLDTLCQLSIDLHGIIVFIVFGAETCIGFIMNMCGCEYKLLSQRVGNAGMEIS